MSSFEVYFPKEDQPSRIKKWKVSKGTVVTPGKILLLYQDVATGKIEKKIRATQFGRVINLLVNENEIIHSKQPIIVMEGCKHPTVMKDLCAECGADLREEFSTNPNKSSVSKAVVPMVHSIPELKVTTELAEKIGRKDEQNLLEHKKLVLLVDLDQTIVHTTNDNVPNDLEDVYHFQLYGPNSPWYHTRLRPHTRKFLSEISKLYELHICTFGARPYAHKIASLLDNDGNLFSHRILSRDECFDPLSKTANLKALFPCGVDMVCIIDDRDDVWQGCANLVQVKPYNYFLHTGDINVPPGLEKGNDSVIQARCFNENMSQNDNNSSGNEDDNKKKESEQNQTNEEEETDTTNSDKKIYNEKDFNSQETLNQEKKSNSNEKHLFLNDNDDYLLYLEDVLKRIHRQFYTETEIKTKSLGEIIPKVRSRVLQGLCLTFSGLVPNNHKLEQSRAYKVAKTFGAQVTQDLCEQTTHLVAIQPGTLKVRDAKKQLKVNIVNPDWLWTCAERWEHVDERLFPLKEVPLHKAREFRKPPAHCSTPEHMLEEQQPSSNVKDNFASSINPLMAFSQEEIAKMDQEVDEDMSDFGDEDDGSNRFKRLYGDVFNESSDSNSNDDLYGYSPMKKLKKLSKKDSENESNASSSFEENQQCIKNLDEEEEEEEDDDDDPVTRFRRGEGLPEDIDLGDNSQDSVCNLEAEDMDDEREWNAMGAALEREFLSD